MTWSRTRNIPLRDLQIDTAHFHGPVRNDHLPSSARKQYVDLYPLARHGSPVSTQRRSFVRNFVILKNEKKEKACNTRCSQAVTHLSTDRARRSLSSEIERDREHSTWYGRRRKLSNFPHSNFHAVFPLNFRHLSVIRLNNNSINGEHFCAIPGFSSDEQTQKTHTLTITMTWIAWIISERHYSKWIRRGGVEIWKFQWLKLAVLAQTASVSL